LNLVDGRWRNTKGPRPRNTARVGNLSGDLPVEILEKEVTQLYLRRKWAGALGAGVKGRGYPGRFFIKGEGEGAYVRMSERRSKRGWTVEKRTIQGGRLRKTSL